GAAPARARLRGRVRSHARNSLPTCRAVPPVAARQAPAGLPLRSAGGHAGLRAGARLRSARSGRLSTRGSPAIVIGGWCFLGRAPVLGEVREIDSNASPGGRSPPHRIDEYVIDLEMRRGRRVPRLPSLEARASLRLVRRLGDGDERLRGRAAATL